MKKLLQRKMALGSLVLAIMLALLAGCSSTPTATTAPADTVAATATTATTATTAPTAEPTPATDPKLDQSQYYE